MNVFIVLLLGIFIAGCSVYAEKAEINFHSLDEASTKIFFASDIYFDTKEKFYSNETVKNLKNTLDTCTVKYIQTENNGNFYIIATIEKQSLVELDYVINCLEGSLSESSINFSLENKDNFFFYKRTLSIKVNFSNIDFIKRLNYEKIPEKYSNNYIVLPLKLIINTPLNIKTVTIINKNYLLPVKEIINNKKYIIYADEENQKEYNPPDLKKELEKEFPSLIGEKSPSYTDLENIKNFLEKYNPSIEIEMEESKIELDQVLTILGFIFGSGVLIELIKLFFRRSST